MSSTQTAIMEVKGLDKRELTCDRSSNTVLTESTPQVEQNKYFVQK